MDIIEQLNDRPAEVITQLTENELITVLTIAKNSYYNSAVSLISDSLYDLLAEKLHAINPRAPVLQKVGAPVLGEKVKLPYTMASQNRISSEKQLDRWLDQFEGSYVVSNKLDGVSCCLIVDHNRVSMYTRGDGTYGKDVSFLASLIQLPLHYLPENKKIVIRGELIMPIDDFTPYATIMSNPRNMVSGIVNSKSQSIVVEHAQKVHFVAYELIYPILKPSDGLKMIKDYRLETVTFTETNNLNLDFLDKTLHKRKQKSIYQLDGLVIVQDLLHGRAMGDPDYSFAYKGISVHMNTKVLEVLWAPSKDGYLIPRIRYQMVRLSGADLEYATGFNAKFIVNNGIGPGANVTVIRSGDTIPHIINVNKRSKSNSLPTQYAYHWDANEVHIVLDHFNKNVEVIKKNLTRFVTEIGVFGLSEGIISHLVDAGINTILKLIALKIDDLMILEGFGTKKANKIYRSLQHSLSKLDLATLMSASNIFGRGFGKIKMEKILRVYPNIIDNYSKHTHVQWSDRLMLLEGFDTITVAKFLHRILYFQKFYDKVQSLITIQPYVFNQKLNGIFANEVIVFTGFRQADWKKYIESEGGTVTSTVSHRTTLVIYNPNDTGKAKFKKALQLGIATLTRSQFSTKYNI